MTLSVQYLTMAMMLLSGITMGIVYDVYRVLTGQLRVLRRFIPLFDLLYWAAVTIFVFRVLNNSNQGQLRFFVFVGLSAGVFIHYLLFSGIVVRIVKWMIAAMRWTARFIRLLFMNCIVKPILWLYRLVVILLSFVASVAIFLLKVVLQFLYPFRILLKWIWKWSGGRVSWSKYINPVKQPFVRIYHKCLEFVRKFKS